MAEGPPNSRPRAAKPSSGPDEQLLVDPETVEAVRRAMVRGGELLREGVGGALVTAGRAVGRGCVAAARWVWPRLRRASVATAQLSWRGLSSAARWSWAKRELLTRMGHRALWWGALAILVLVGQALLSGAGDAELLESAFFWFVGGLSMSVLVLVGAPETRMRVGAFALASGHGALGLLVLLTSA